MNLTTCRDHTASVVDPLCVDLRGHGRFNGVIETVFGASL